MHSVVQERRRGDKSLTKRQPAVVRRHGVGDQGLDPSRGESLDEAFGKYFVEEAAAAPNPTKPATSVPWNSAAPAAGSRPSASRPSSGRKSSTPPSIRQPSA